MFRHTMAQRCADVRGQKSTRSRPEVLKSKVLRFQLFRAQGCKRVDAHGPASNDPSEVFFKVRVHRARSWIRASPSTHSSTLSAQIRNPPQLGGRGTTTSGVLAPRAGPSRFGLSESTGAS